VGLPSFSISRPGRPTLRHLWLVPGIAIGLSAGMVAETLAVGLVPLLLFGIAPHAAVLLGIGQERPQGHIAPRAVPLSNVLHEPAIPLALMAVAAIGPLAPFWLVASLAWLGHIVADWGVGGGLHHRDGSWRGRTSLRLPRTVGVR
jgi:hypothetical protein